MKKSKNFTVDARTVLQLGRDSIRSHVTALVELVKNSYDADASIVEVEIFKNVNIPYIRIADNGFGMTEGQIDDNWLRIGYSEKKLNKRTSKKRRKTGEKGIGRIAADRLGKTLQLTSKAKGNTIQGLKVNWELFDVDNRDVKDIKIEVLQSSILSIPEDGNIGTEIIITELRQEWNESALDSLINQLKLLTSPFKKIDNFKLIIKTDIKEFYNNTIIDFNDTILKLSEISIEAIVTPKDKQITYELFDRTLNDTFISEVPIKQLLDDSYFSEDADFKIPTLEFKILFFLRDKKLSKKDLITNRKEFLGNLDLLTGVKIYRDLIAIRPYGFIDSSSWDWLELGNRKAQNPAGVKRKSYRISPNQLVGAVFIERDKNKKLKDSAAREGIMEEHKEFSFLKELLFKAIELIEAHRHKVATNQLGDFKESKAPSEQGTQGTLDFFSDELNLISNSLKIVGETISTRLLTLDQKNDVKNKLNQAAANIQSTTKVIIDKVEEMLDENRVLKGLATLGITNTVFAHETQGALNTIHLGIDNANRYIKRIPKDFKYKDKLIKSITTIQNKTKIIKGWGNFALVRIEIDKRKNPKKKKVHEVIKRAVDEISDAFLAVNIEINANEIDKIISKVYPMDLESILFNLLSNSYKACLQVSDRKVFVGLERKVLNKTKGFVLIVEDSGLGIANEFIFKIWEPLFSTKYGDSTTRGTGLGLTIVQSVTNDLNGEVKAIKNGEIYGGARFEVWLPII